MLGGAFVYGLRENVVKNDLLEYLDCEVTQKMLLEPNAKGEYSSPIFKKELIRSELTTLSGRSGLIRITPIQNSILTLWFKSKSGESVPVNYRMTGPVDRELKLLSKDKNLT